MTYQVWSGTEKMGKLLWELESEFPLSNAAVKSRCSDQAIEAGFPELAMRILSGFVFKKGMRIADRVALRFIGMVGG